MTVKFYQAECGDAASIRFLGNDNRYHNVFIDSGYERTFRLVLEEEIEKIRNAGELIDLWIISHIHDDHIGGVKKYIEDLKYTEEKDLVVQYFYNAPRKYDFNISSKNASELSSIAQGDILYEYLKSNGKLLNEDVTNDLEAIDLYGLKLTILSPNNKKLDYLRLKYILDNIKPFESEEDEIVSEAVSPKQNDYNTLIADFDLNKHKEDTSIENGSSISLLTEYGNTRILWLADSHPSDIVNSLRNLKFSIDNKLTCDLVKISHHGSTGNTNQELVDLLECNNFLFSSDGENRHRLPTKECIARILRKHERNADSKYNLYFTYSNDTLKSIFQNEKYSIFQKYRFDAFYNNKKYLIFKYNSLNF